MKCPHCNFERETPFAFCPMCGVKSVVDEVKTEALEQKNEENSHFIQTIKDLPYVNYVEELK